MSIDEILEQKIESAAERIIEQKLAPVAILQGYGETLTVEDLCEVLNRSDRNAKGWIRSACERGELPFVKIGDSLFFHKSQLIRLFTGDWKPEKPKNKAKATNLPKDVLEFARAK